MFRNALTLNGTSEVDVLVQAQALGLPCWARGMAVLHQSTRATACTDEAGVKSKSKSKRKSARRAAAKAAATVAEARRFAGGDLNPCALLASRLREVHAVHQHRLLYVLPPSGD